jgi:TusA-related sulfurtransferase
VSGDTTPPPASPGPSAPLDLRGTPCPLNFIRTRLALEKLPAGSLLEVWLDAGEPEWMVSQGVRGEGHSVELLPAAAESTATATATANASVRLRIRRAG